MSVAVQEAGPGMVECEVTHDLPCDDPTPAPLRVRVGMCSERGARAKNDDCVASSPGCGVYAVSDGIGGAPDGDYMSRVGCGASIGEFERTGNIATAFRSGNEAAVKVSEWIGNPDCGATLLLASVRGARLALAWAGDSAAFLLRGGELARLTRTGRRPGGNSLESAIGYSYGLDPEVAEHPLCSGDRVLLCTDGVWETFEGKLGYDALATLLAGGDSAPWLADEVCERAAEAGTDNASAIVLLVEERGGSDDDEEGR